MINLVPGASLGFFLGSSESSLPMYLVGYLDFSYISCKTAVLELSMAWKELLEALTLVHSYCF